MLSHCKCASLITLSGGFSSRTEWRPTSPLFVDLAATPPGPKVGYQRNNIAIRSHPVCWDIRLQSSWTPAAPGLAQDLLIRPSLFTVLDPSLLLIHTSYLRDLRRRGLRHRNCRLQHARQRQTVIYFECKWLPTS